MYPCAYRGLESSISNTEEFNDRRLEGKGGGDWPWFLALALPSSGATPSRPTQGRYALVFTRGGGYLCTK